MSDVTSAKDAVAEVIKETGYDPDTGEVGEPAVETTETPKETETLEEATETVETTEEAPEIKEGKETPSETQEEEESLSLTAEELAAIDKDPNLKKAYRSMVRGLTAKTTATANLRKEAESALETIKTIQNDPIKAAKAMALAVGLKVVEEPAAAPTEPVKEPILTRITKGMEAKLGKEAAAVLAPTLLEIVKELNAEENAPLREALERQEKLNGEQVLRNAVAEFGAKVVKDGGEWNEEVEKEMTGLIGKIIPGQGVTLPEFLEVLHNNVQTKRGKKAVVGRQVTRIRAAAEVTEPTRPSRPTAPSPVLIKAGMDPREATRLAIEEATKEAQTHR